MTRGIGLRALLVGLVMLTSPAQAYVAFNNFTIREIAPGRFEVYPRGGLNPIDAWCAVGDYVMTVLSLPPATPIWRLSEPPRPRGASILFSLSAEGAASDSGLHRIDAEHVYLTAAAARAFCPASRQFWEFF